eukprot:scaffold706_cov418-Prasinococcus_capsulatus_cf.AAC.4
MHPSWVLRGHSRPDRCLPVCVPRDQACVELHFNCAVCNLYTSPSNSCAVRRRWPVEPKKRTLSGSIGGSRSADEQVVAFKICDAR